MKYFSDETFDIYDISPEAGLDNRKMKHWYIIHKKYIHNNEYFIIYIYIDNE